MEQPNPNEDFGAAMRAAEARSGVEEPESTEGSGTGALGAVTPPPPPPVEDDQGTAQAGEGSAEDERLAKLEAQLAEAQSMIGRQANEIGELRKQPEAQAAEDYVEGTGFVTQDSWDTIEQTFEEKGGAGLMLNVSHTSPELIDAALAYWKAQGDPEAFLYEQELWRTEAQLAQQAAPEAKPDEDVQTLLRRDAQRSAESQLLSEYGKDRLQELTPQFKDGLEQLPESVKTALAADLNSTDPQKIVGAFKAVAALLPGGTGGGEVARLAADQAEAAKRAGKQAAAVNIGSQGGGAQGESALPTSPEEMAALDAEQRKIAASKIMGDRILGKVTSVQAELAKNKASQQA